MSLLYQPDKLTPSPEDARQRVTHTLHMTGPPSQTATRSQASTPGRATNCQDTLAGASGDGSPRGACQRPLDRPRTMSVLLTGQRTLALDRLGQAQERARKAAARGKGIVGSFRRFFQPEYRQGTGNYRHNASTNDKDDANTNQYVYVYICMYVFTYIPIYLHTYLPIYLCIYIYIHIHICVCIYIYIYSIYMYVYTIYMCIYIYIYT